MVKLVKALLHRPGSWQPCFHPGSTWPGRFGFSETVAVKLSSTISWKKTCYTATLSGCPYILLLPEHGLYFMHAIDFANVGMTIATATCTSTPPKCIALSFARIAAFLARLRKAISTEPNIAHAKEVSKSGCKSLVVHTHTHTLHLYTHKYYKIWNHRIVTDSTYWLVLACLSKCMAHVRSLWMWICTPHAQCMVRSKLQDFWESIHCCCLATFQNTPRLSSARLGIFGSRKKFWQRATWHKNLECIFHWHANLPWKPAVDEALVMAAVVYLLFFHKTPMWHLHVLSRSVSNLWNTLQHIAMPLATDHLPSRRHRLPGRPGLPMCRQKNSKSVDWPQNQDHSTVIASQDLDLHTSIKPVSFQQVCTQGLKVRLKETNQHWTACSWNSYTSTHWSSIAPFATHVSVTCPGLAFLLTV